MGVWVVSGEERVKQIWDVHPEVWTLVSLPLIYLKFVPVDSIEEKKSQCTSLNPCCCCWISVVVVRSVALSLNLWHCHQTCFVVESTLLLLNLCCAAFGIVWHSNPWHCCQSHVIVESVLSAFVIVWHPNAGIQLVHIVYGEVCCVVFHRGHTKLCCSPSVVHQVVKVIIASSLHLRYVRWVFIEVDGFQEWVRKNRQSNNRYIYKTHHACPPGLPWSLILL